MGKDLFKRYLNILFFSIFCYLLPSIVVNALTFERNVNEFLEHAPTSIKNDYLIEPFSITDEWFNEEGKLLDILYNETVYVKTTTFYSYNSVISSEEIVSSDEYKNNSISSTLTTCKNGRAIDCWETNYKRLSLFVFYDSTVGRQDVEVLVVNTWKEMPSVKSFDTIGLLYTSEFVMSDAYGYQIYNTSSNQSKQQIRYGFKGNNMKLSINSTDISGVSISQNILDDVHSLLENQLWVKGKLNNNLEGRFTASYQHAVEDITLAISKDFEFSADGMGRVFAWNQPYSNWDNMRGVCANISPYLWFC